MQVYHLEKRQKLLDEGILIPKGDFLHLDRDYPFGSPTEAASILKGFSDSGPKGWKADEGDTPLRQFKEATRTLPRTTKAERLVIQRIGQYVFRASLMDYWEGRCPLTGISDPELLRASHIKPWKDCETDEIRLDLYNGLLLSALWDVAFDRCLVTFDAEGQPEFSSHLKTSTRLIWLGTAKNLNK